MSKPDLQKEKALFKEHTPPTLQLPQLPPQAALRLRIHANRDISHHTLRHIIAIKRHDIQHRIEPVLRLLAEDAIDGVGGAVDGGVASVRLERDDLLGQVLSGEDLAGRDGVGRRDGAVGAHDPVVVDLDVDVDGALDVEAGEDGLELGDAVLVGRPLRSSARGRESNGDIEAYHSAQERGVVGVQVVADGGVELVQQLFERRVRAQAREAGVAAGGVAVPDVDEHVGQRLAAVDVHDADVEVQRHAGLALGHVLAERLAAGPDVGAAGDLLGEDAGVVLEDVVVRRLGVDREGGVGGGAGGQVALRVALSPALAVHSSGSGLAALRQVRTPGELCGGKIVVRVGSDAGEERRPKGEEESRLHGLQNDRPNEGLEKKDWRVIVSKDSDSVVTTLYRGHPRRVLHHNATGETVPQPHIDATPVPFPSMWKPIRACVISCVYAFSRNTY